MSTDRTAEIIRRYCEGESLVKIGASYNITRERVRQILGDNGVERRGLGAPALFRVKESFGKLTTKERFMKHVTIRDDPNEDGQHWVWSKLILGRGRFRMRGKTYYAHQAAHILTTGKLPVGRLFQTCTVEGCVKPQHWVPKSSK